MVGCAWSALHRLSPFALDSLTLNFSYTETSTDVDMRRYFVELYCYITYCVSEHQCLVPDTLVRSVWLWGYWRWLSLFSLPVALSKLFESVKSGNYRQLKFWNRRHDTEYIAWSCYCLYLVPVVRGLVAGHLRSQRLPAHPSQNKQIASSYYSTLYSMMCCFIFANPSWVRPSVQSIFLISNFFQKRITDFNLF